jgi:hypothetical protein
METAGHQRRHLQIDIGTYFVFIRSGRRTRGSGSRTRVRKAQEMAITILTRPNRW